MQPGQAALWEPVEAAIRKIAKDAAARKQERGKMPAPADFVDLLERTANAEAVRAEDLKMLASALKPLAAALSEEQKRRIPAFLGLREHAQGPAAADSRTLAFRGRTVELWPSQG